MDNNGKIWNLMLMLIRVGMGITDIASESVKYEPELMPDVYKKVKHHDLAHIVAYALKKNNLECEAELLKKFDKQHMIAMFRYQHQKIQLDNLSAALEEAQIPHIPLKGSVIRKYYPFEWMRVGCDIDVLVKPEDLEKAASVLTDKLSYQRGDTNSHDIQFYSPSGTHVELHFDLIEDRVHGKDTVLESFWNYAKPDEGKSYRMSVSDGMFYYYHVAHSAKHIIVGGGCGIRPFLDLWILENKVLSADREEREKLLSEGGYLKFADCSRMLSEVWFGGMEHNDTTKKLEAFIINGGVYGSFANLSGMRASKKKSRIGYLLRRIFPSYKTLRPYYPGLDGKPLLLPFFHVYRWFKIIFRGKFKRSVSEIKTVVTFSEDFLSKIGIE